MKRKEKIVNWSLYGFCLVLIGVDVGLSFMWHKPLPPPWICYIFISFSCHFKWMNCKTQCVLVHLSDLLMCRFHLNILLQDGAHMQTFYLRILINGRVQLSNLTTLLNNVRSRWIYKLFMGRFVLGLRRSILTWWFQWFRRCKLILMWCRLSRIVIWLVMLQFLCLKRI